MTFRCYTLFNVSPYLENNHSTLFFIREYTDKLTKNLPNSTTTSWRGWRSVKTICCAPERFERHILGLAPPPQSGRDAPRGLGCCKAVTSGLGGWFCAINDKAGITRQQAHSIGLTEAGNGSRRTRIDRRGRSGIECGG